MLTEYPDLPGELVMLSDGRPADTKAALNFFQEPGFQTCLPLRQSQHAYCSGNCDAFNDKQSPLLAFLRREFLQRVPAGHLLARPACRSACARNWLWHDGGKLCTAATAGVFERRNICTLW